MKNLEIRRLTGAFNNNVGYSDKVYKVIGLKCNPEELPESLMFMTIDGIEFKIPYILNSNAIIEYSLQKNIMLVGKILSYFELEEIHQSSRAGNSENNGVVVEHIFKEEKGWIGRLTQVDMISSRTRLLKSAMGYFESMYKRQSTMANLGLNGQFFKEKDINAYWDYRHNTPAASIAEQIVIGKITEKSKIKGFPKSIIKLFIKFNDKYDHFMNVCEKHTTFRLPSNLMNEPVDSVTTQVLKNIISFTTNCDGSTRNFRATIKSLDIENETDFIDMLNVMFEKNFKYTKENINDFIDMSRFFQSSINIKNSIDTGYQDFINNQNSNSSFIVEEHYKFMLELLDGTDVFEPSKVNPQDENAKYYVREFSLACLYEYSNQISASGPSVIGTKSMPIMVKEIGTSAETLAAKFKDMINLQWSDELLRTVRFSTRDLEESIRHRYFFPSSLPGEEGRRPFIDQRNMVVDTLLPQSMFTSKMDVEKTYKQFQASANLNTKTSYAISPLTAAAFGCKQIQTEHLCRILGFTKDKIKEMMNIIKNRNLSFVFVGAGGTGNNTAIWLSKMLDMVNLPFLFNKIYVFEKESAEIHNLLRFPKDPYQITIDSNIFGSYNGTMTDKNKCNIIASELRSLSKDLPSCYERYIAYDDKPGAYPSLVFSNNTTTEPVLDPVTGEVIDFASITRYVPRPGTIFYGAPDIDTRQNLSNIGNFISATHSSNNCNVYINPEQDAMIQVESYGMIQLAPFFMNQLRMSIALLEILSDVNYLELLSRKDHEFLSYEFNGEPVLKNDRVYNFKIISNPEMATENQAQNTTLDF